MVAGAGREGGEQQGRLHRGIHSHAVAHARGRGAPGVDDDHDVPVALGAPGAQHRRRRPRGRAPVDRAHVVAAHVLAQAVELGALPAHLHARVAVELAQPGEARGQMPAGGEGRQHADRRRPRRCATWRPAIRSGPSERTTTNREVELAAAPREQRDRRRRGSRRAGCSIAGCSAGAPAVGCHASRTRPRSVRAPGVAQSQLGRRRSGRGAPGAARGARRCTARGSGAAAASASVSERAQQRPSPTPRATRRRPRPRAARRAPRRGRRGAGGGR